MSTTNVTTSSSRRIWAGIDVIVPAGAGGASMISGTRMKSELVADAYVSYSGTGPLTRTNERRGLAKWLHSAADWVWPF